jgi:site-specific DNA-cytosine methylase
MANNTLPNDCFKSSIQLHRITPPQHQDHIKFPDPHRKPPHSSDGRNLKKKRAKHELEDEEAGAEKEEEKRNRAKETRTEMKKNKPAPIWTRWCGGLTASSSNHHHRHVYIVKRKIWIWERWKADLRFSERG